MAWFDDFDLPGSTITGYFGFVREDGRDEDDNPDVRLAGGSVTFTPTAPAVRADGAWLGIEPVTAQIFEGEIIISEEDPRPVRILSTDADTGVDGWGWVATFDIPGAQVKPIRFLTPTNGVHLTGDSLIPITGNPVEVITGATGDSAYEIAVAHGFVGTEEEWLASLKADGLQVQVDALAYRSGQRNITALLDPAPVSGNLYIERRGDTVWLDVDAVTYDHNVASLTFYNVITDGFQAIKPVDLPSSPRTPDDQQGNFRTYNHVFVMYRLAAEAPARGLVSWPTNDAIPTDLPGDAA